MLTEPSRSSTPKILIIDDDRLINNALMRAIKRMGYDVTCRFCLVEGYDEAISNPYDVIYLDARLPDGNGIEALPEFIKTPSSPLVIIITGHSNSNGAERAIYKGAWWYIRKPASMSEMTLPLIRALEYRDTKKIECPVIREDGAIMSVQGLNFALRLLYEYINYCIIAERSGYINLCDICLKYIIEKCDQQLGKNVVFPKPFQRSPHPLRRTEDLADSRHNSKILMFPR